MAATLATGMQRPTATLTRSGISSSTFAMDEDVRAKTRACAGETSAAAASRIIAQWAARRHQACEQMVLTTLDLDRRDRESELIALARLHAVSMLDASFLRAADDRGDVGRRRARSPERALVRRIAREWAASPRGGGESAARGRVEEWMGETERERVRSVRERVRMASQGGPDQRPTRDREGELPRLRLRGRQARADVVTRMAMERQRELQGLSEHRAVSAFAHRGRIQYFLRGRFFHSRRPMNDERPLSMAARELGQLRQSHPVSRLREEVRFQTESIIRDQATSEALAIENSSANNELDSVTHQVVTDDNHHINNAIRDYEIQIHRSMEDEALHTVNTVPDGNDVLQNDFAQEEIHQYDEYSDSGSSEQGSDHSGSAFSTASSSSMQQEAETYGQQTDLQWSRDISVREDGHDNAFLHRDEEWHVIDSLESEPQWQSGRSFSSSRNINRFSPPDDDVYGVELRELLSRRSVSNLLSSGFRESLDQLIQSYVQRQEHDPHDWDFEGQRPTTSLLNEDHTEHSIDELNLAESDTAPQPSTVLPGQTHLQEQRQWPIELPHHSWSQQSMHRSEFDWDAIHVLRDELTGVQRGMTSMQQMLEACMEMQIELQRSIKQEVSAALNRSLTVRNEETLEDGSQWKLARKGTCCICCDRQIDSLLYRCGHMCTCSKCSSELLHGVGKCPLCRAPIVEVIRAYCIM
uniref:RING-type domain-containing protein n=1 Tax=Arundo donax TaxID=35708 RepID=A0A0A9DTT5_ARUDO